MDIELKLRIAAASTPEQLAQLAAACEACDLYRRAVEECAHVDASAAFRCATLLNGSDAENVRSTRVSR